MLEDNGYSPLEANSPQQARDMVQQQAIDLILLDMNYALDTTSGEEGITFLSWLSQSEFNIPVVAMTAWSSVPLAVKAMQLGAGDFIENVSPTMSVRWIAPNQKGATIAKEILA